MPEPSFDHVMAAVDSLLAAAMDEAQMPAAAETMRQLFDGSKACFAGFGPNPEDWAAYATNPDPALQARCFGELAYDFVAMGLALRHVPVGQVYRDEQVHGREALRRSRVWQEWMQPQDMFGGMACRLAENGEAFWFFDVQRGRGQSGFDEADAALLGRLYPVLRRVVEVRRHIGQVSIQRDDAREALDSLSLGIAIVDQEMRIVYANEAADEILSDPGGAITLRQGRLTTRLEADQRPLQRMVADALHSLADPLTCRRSNLLLRGPEPARAVSASVMPITPALGGPHRKIMVALRPLGMVSEIAACARQLFDLTETEARIAACLAGGASLSEAATAQRVRISTARTHLARIFQKTETRQQSQLVSLLRSAALPLRSR